MRGKRTVAIAIAVGMLFFAASFVVARSIKQTTAPPPTASPHGVVIERDSIRVPGSGATFPDLPERDRADTGTSGSTTATSGTTSTSGGSTTTGTTGPPPTTDAGTTGTGTTGTSTTGPPPTTGTSGGTDGTSSDTSTTTTTG